MTEAMRIRTADPELVSILDGTCTAGLKAAVLGGDWSATAASAEQRQAEERDQLTQQLFESKPFEESTANLTRQMMLQALAPDVAAQAQASAAPDPTGRADLSEAQRKAAEAEESRVRQESFIKGMAMSPAQYERQRVRRQMIQMHVADMNRVGRGDD